MKGIQIDALFDVFEESPQNRRAPPLVRVEKMIKDIQSRLPGAPQFLLCLLPERKNSNLYGLFDLIYTFITLFLFLFFLFFLTSHYNK
ncbi:unnamed protein product [Camellia sinensis]